MNQIDLVIAISILGEAHSEVSQLLWLSQRHQNNRIWGTDLVEPVACLMS